ncbi:MAG: hypothetical protein QM820_58790 [Minicystis sp.]
MTDRLNPQDEIPIGGELVSADGHSVLAMQADGNLVLYYQHDDGRREARWATGSTFGLAVSQCVMQGDGNFVLYGHPASRALWSTGTWGHPGAFLIVQDDGNVVLYDGDKPLWATGTVIPRTTVQPLLFGPDRREPGITFQRRVTIRPGRSLVAHFNFQSAHESAIMVYDGDSVDRRAPVVLAERGNHGRDGGAFPFTNETTQPVDLVFSGWYKNGPPSGALPWLEHRSDEIFGRQQHTTNGTLIRSFRFDETRGAVGPEVVVDTVVF